MTSNIHWYCQKVQHFSSHLSHFMLFGILKIKMDTLIIYFSFWVDIPSWPGTSFWKSYSFSLSAAAISNNGTFEKVQLLLQTNSVCTWWSTRSQRRFRNNRCLTLPKRETEQSPLRIKESFSVFLYLYL